MTIASQLVGVWKLISYRNEQKGSEDSFPFGPEPAGFLIYTPDGFVSAQLMAPGRAPFQSQDWIEGTPEEYQEAGHGYIAYSGSYQVHEEGATVTHLPSVALVPNLILKRQLRSVVFSGDRLTLSTPGNLTANGAIVTIRMEWQRASASSQVDIA